MAIPYATVLQDSRVTHDKQKVELVDQITRRVQHGIPTLLIQHVGRLCERLREHSDEKRGVNLSDAVRSTMYDISTALIVGDCESLLSEDDFGNRSLKRFSSLMRYSSLHRHFPWIKSLLHFIPKWFCYRIFPLQVFKEVSTQSSNSKVSPIHVGISSRSFEVHYSHNFFSSHGGERQISGNLHGQIATDLLLSMLSSERCPN